MIMNRTNPIIAKHLNDTQLGFRKGKGTRYGIFLLRNTCERMMDCQKGPNLCFIDYAKAFDRVNHEKLMEVCAKAEIPSHERRLVYEIYWNQSAKVKLTSGTTEDIMIQRGVRQRCIVSLSLFNLYRTANIYCKMQSPKRAAYSSRASDMPMTLSSWQSQKNNFRLCWIASLTNAKSMAWRSTRRRPRRCTLEGTQIRLQ
ncbi:LINE-1 reverse transcriptase [Elysia marginata]|uniref:LINE-1 reverse transcriptase n=1 Tax=Elysia marginata TaxID=1093978 RepID=A0AAV4FD06_9GAST|nr:LINE-1 reverse transcriptase [Elysia marginata]